LNDQMRTYFTERVAGELSELTGEPPIICWMAPVSGVTAMLRKILCAEPVMLSLLKLVYCLPS